MDDIAKFLPRVARDLVLLRPRASGSCEPRLCWFQAGVLFVDVSGYTSLTQRAMGCGPEAVEQFYQRLNGFFERIIGHVQAGGGDVLGFAGDAILAVFPSRMFSPANDAAQSAALCALACRAEGLDLSGTALATPQPLVATRITVGFGPVCIALFGAERRQHLLATGEAVQEVAGVQGSARSGAILLTGRARDALAGKARCTEASEGLAFLEALPAPTAPAPPLPAPRAAGSDEALLAFLPKALGIQVRKVDLAWAAEMRFVCPVFLFLGPGERSAVPGLQAYAEAVLAFEDELLAVGGEVLHVRVDEHGVVAVGLFGTPGCTHEDDAARAVRAARQAHGRLQGTGLRADLGVASGPAMCAIYGTRERCDYDVLGNVMNLAARLMQRHAGVLCEAETARLAGLRFEPAEAGTLVLKGLSAPVQVLALHGGQRVERPARTTAAVIGRARERASLCAWLEAAGARSLLLVGDAGMGKTTLVRFLQAQAAARELRCIVVQGSSTEHLTPYFVWRAVLHALFAGPDDAAGEALPRCILRALESEQRLRHFAPLLNEIVPLGLAPNATTLQMEASARATTTAELLLYLVQRAGAGCVLVFEDAHWVDSASWPVIARLARSQAGPRVLVTVRTDAALPAAGREFVDEAGAQALRLAGLDDSEAAGLIAHCTGSGSTAEDVARFVREHAAGNPLFIEELALLLQRRGQLRVEAGACIAREGLDRFARHELPMTMRAAILERIDALGAPQLLLAKLASVAGAEAELRMLRELLPATGLSPEVGAGLEQLQAHALGAVQEADRGPVFVFRHAVIREAVYGMMTPSQQRALHLAVGEWLEAQAGGRTALMAPVLAHHFRCAQDRERAVRYLRQAGEQALQAHANGEAVHFLAGALALQPGGDAVGSGTARLRRQLAEAHLKLSNLASCREQLVAGLATLGQPLPARRAALWLAIARGALAAAVRKPAAAAGEGQAEVEFLAAQFHQLRAEVAYFEHDAASLLHGTLSCLRKTAAAGPSRERAISHGTAAIVLGLLGAAGSARRHLAAAEAAARGCGHLPTIAYVQHLACVCHSAVGDWEAAEAAVQAAAQGYREVGELYRWQSTRMILAYQALHRGDFARALAHLQEADEASVFPSGPQQVRIWFRTAQLAAQNAAALLGTAPLPSAALVREVEQLAELADPSQALLCHGFAADALRLQGRWPQARECAERGLAVLRAHRPTTYYSLLGIASICGTFLCLAEHEPADWPLLRPRAAAALRALQVFALMVPIARPSVQLLRGRMLLLAGRTAAGERRLRKALACAERLGTSGIAAAARRMLEMAEDSGAERATQTGWI